jgi:putative intracellular protease/amidase
MLDIVIPIYDDFTALDAVGPYEVLSRIGGRVRFVAREAGPVRTDNGMLSVIAEASLEDASSPDILVVPGGVGTRALTTDDVWLDWIRSVHASSTWTTSVCTGSLLLAAAGLLEDAPATTHWVMRETLAELGAVPVLDRVVRHGKIITAAGVSSGIDMALMLVQAIYGDEVAQAVQLGIEYDPAPPFDAGSPDKVPPALADAVKTVFMSREAEVLRAGKE